MNRFLCIAIIVSVLGNTLSFRLFNGLLAGKARDSSISHRTAQKIKHAASLAVNSRFSLNMATKVSGVAFYVEDIAQSTKFYENKVTVLSKSENFAEFSIGDSAKMTLKKFSKLKEEDRDFEKGDVGDHLHLIARKKMFEHVVNRLFGDSR